MEGEASSDDDEGSQTGGTPGYFKPIVGLAGVVAFDLQLKVWEYGVAPFVLWQLRNVFYALYEPAYELHHFIRSEWNKFDEVLADMGMDISTHFFRAGGRRRHGACK